MTLDHILVSPEFSARPKKHLASSDSLKAWWPIAKRILPRTNRDMGNNLDSGDG